MNLEELLQALGASTAKDVTLSRLPHASSTDARTAGEVEDTRRTATSAGKCIAVCGGKERSVEWWEADALAKAGAKDSR
jgi:hypothetical protein